MKKLFQTWPIQDPMSPTPHQLVVAARESSRNDDATRVINHLLLTEHVRFVESLDQEEIKLLHS